MQRIKARAPPSFKPQVLDTEKRLNILFDHLNNEDLLKPDTISEMNELSQAVQARQYEEAQAIFTDIMTNKTSEGSNWMVCYSLLIVALASDIQLDWSKTPDRNEPCNAAIEI